MRNPLTRTAIVVIIGTMGCAASPKPTIPAPMGGVEDRRDFNLVVQVWNATDGAPVPMANLGIGGPGLDTLWRFGLTTRTGYTRIADVPPGTYRMRISALGYKVLEQTYTMQPGVHDTLRIALDTLSVQPKPPR
ncbi:MAG: carboxypeptidase-like regulatory domain-containing protein [Gemmatimonadota bacterium]